MDNMGKHILCDNDIATVAEYARRIREQIHRNPELGFEEFNTAELIVSELKRMGCNHIKTGIAGTGVMAIIEGKKPGNVIMLRVDIDAMPMPDTCEAEYRSMREGKCHSCGHDVHTALGLGTAMLMQMQREELCGTVKVLFQASEERPYKVKDAMEYDCFIEPPVGIRSASLSIEDGVLDDPMPNRVLGIHCWPQLEVGKIGYEHGAAMAGTGNFHISVIGKSGHAATPHKAVDALAASVAVIQALYELISRKCNPSLPVALNIGTIKGGRRRSVICGQVDMAGTVRCADNEFISNTMPSIMENAIKYTCAARGAQYVFDYGVDQPPVINDDEFTEFCECSLIRLLGEDAVELNECPMTAEDFAFYAQRIPSVYLKLGTCGGESTAYPLHNSNFDVDPRCYGVGLKALTGIICDYLRQ